MVFGMMFRENIRFYLRTKRFQVILPLYAVLSAVIPILMIQGTIPKPSDVYSFTQQTLGGIADDILLICSLLAGDAISRDFSREGYFTLTQPVRRSAIMLARFLSAFVAAVIVLAVSVVIGIGFSEYMYSTVVSTLPEIVIAAVLFAASLTAFVMMFSSLFKNAALSIVISILVVIVAMPIVQTITQFLSHVEPWFLVTYAAGVISNLAQKNYPPHVVTQQLGAGRTFFVYTPTLVEGVLIMLGYLVISGFITWAVYTRRELK